MNYGNNEFASGNVDNLGNVNSELNNFLPQDNIGSMLVENDVSGFTPGINMQNMNENEYFYSNNQINNPIGNNFPECNEASMTSSEYTTTMNKNNNNGNINHNDINMNINTKNTKKSSSSKSSEKNSTPNSSNGPTDEELYQRRKAQNRAAQRAFRERKEGKLKELSGKLRDAELARERLEKQLNDLKQKNMLLDMENQLLQKQQQNLNFNDENKSSFNSIDSSNDDNSPITNIIKDNINKDNSTNTSNNNNNSSNLSNITKVLSFKFPNTSKSDFINGTIDWAHHGKDQTSSISEANKLGKSYEIEQEKVLTISAVWDYLVEFAKLNDDLVLDIPGIMHELRGSEVCHGFGPAYPIELVNEIILRHIGDDDD